MHRAHLHGAHHLCVLVQHRIVEAILTLLCVCVWVGTGEFGTSRSDGQHKKTALTLRADPILIRILIFLLIIILIILLLMHPPCGSWRLTCLDEILVPIKYYYYIRKLLLLLLLLLLLSSSSSSSGGQGEGGSKRVRLALRSFLYQEMRTVCSEP
jgi:hypothetical protein